MCGIRVVGVVVPMPGLIFVVAIVVVVFVNHDVLEQGQPRKIAGTVANRELTGINGEASPLSS